MKILNEKFVPPNPPLANSNNRMVKSCHYGKILREYNKIFLEKGFVNDAKFYREVVAPIMPEYKSNTWYQFIKRFKNASGLRAATIISEEGLKEEGLKKEGLIDPSSEENKFVENMASNEVATRKGIQAALNIGASRLSYLIDNPQLMTAKDAIDLLFKAMKAQDSRIGALGKIKSDSREEEKFNREFNKSAYG